MVTWTTATWQCVSVIIQPTFAILYFSRSVQNYRDTQSKHIRSCSAFRTQTKSTGCLCPTEAEPVTCVTSHYSVFHNNQQKKEDSNMIRAPVVSLGFLQPAPVCPLCLRAEWILPTNVNLLLSVREFHLFTKFKNFKTRISFCSCHTAQICISCMDFASHSVLIGLHSSLLEDRLQDCASFTASVFQSTRSP